jgi:hypothetical protein
MKSGSNLKNDSHEKSLADIGILRPIKQSYKIPDAFLSRHVFAFSVPLVLKSKERSRVVTYGQTRTNGQKDMTKLIVAFRNFAKAPNKWL